MILLLIAGIAAVLALIWTALVLWSRRPVRREYTVESSKLPEGTELRLLLLSDLHGRLDPPAKALLQKVQKEFCPDMAVLAGDLAEGEDARAALELMALLAPLPMAAIPGNHEYYGYDPDEGIDALKTGPAEYLRNRGMRIDLGGLSMLLWGMDDLMGDRIMGKARDASFVEAQNTVSAFDGFSVLLLHRPDEWCRALSVGADLVLCGHTHGGQWRIPGLLNGLYAPGQGLFPRHAGGLYREEKSTVIISRGFSNPVFVPRFGDPTEIVTVTVRRTGRREGQDG